MIPEIPCGVIKLGNINFTCLIFQINSDNSYEILSSSIEKSKGIHNGAIVNSKHAADAIRSCISDAEKKANLSLKKINLVIEQPEFLCTKFSKHKKINGSKIHKDDIDFLLKEAKKQVTLNDYNQSIIHIFNHNYVVDGKNFMEEPIGVYADFLSHEMTFITMPKNNMKNIKQAFIDCDIEIERFIFSTFALAVRLLNQNELKNGSILIDVGYEQTSFAIFKNLALIHSMTLPVGINHIAKDFSKVCSLTLDESINILNSFNFSFEENSKIFGNTFFMKKDYFTTSSYRKINRKLIEDVAKARVDEILLIIKKQLNISGINSNISNTVCVTGGGSYLNNFCDYFSNFFKLDVKKIEKNKKNGINDQKFDSCLGAIKIIKDGWETEAIPEQSRDYNEKIGFFSKIFGNRS